MTMHPQPATTDTDAMGSPLGPMASGGAVAASDNPQFFDPDQLAAVPDHRNRQQQRGSNSPELQQFLAGIMADDEGQPAPIEPEPLQPLLVLPPDHPAQLLARTGPDSLIWRAAQAQTPQAAQPSEEAQAQVAHRHPEWMDDAEQMRLYAVNERMAELRDNCERSAKAAAATLMALAELLDTTGDAPTDDVADVDTATDGWPAEPDDWPPEPPPQHLALTTSTLTAAPPAPAPPVSEALRRVILAA